MNYSIGIRAAVWLVLSATCSIVASDWPQWRGPQRNSLSQETSLLKERYVGKVPGSQTEVGQSMTSHLWDVWFFRKPAEAAIPMDGGELVREYVQCLRFRDRLWRIGPVLAGYFGALLLLMLVLGFPTVPYRGSSSKLTDYCMLGTSVFALLLTIFLLMDATLVCTWFIRMVSEPTTWKAAREGSTDFLIRPISRPTRMARSVFWVRVP